MPDLPTLTVSEEHYALLVAAFPGATAQQKIDNYLAWLTNHLIDVVENQNVQRVEAEVAAYRDTRMAEVSATLPPRPPMPVFTI